MRVHDIDFQDAVSSASDLCIEKVCHYVENVNERWITAVGESEDNSVDRSINR